jgi:hypothetical protein
MKRYRQVSTVSRWKHCFMVINVQSPARWGPFLNCSSFCSSFHDSVTCKQESSMGNSPVPSAQPPPTYAMGSSTPNERSLCCVTHASVDFVQRELFSMENLSCPLCSGEATNEWISNFLNLVKTADRKSDLTSSSRL